MSGNSDLDRFWNTAAGVLLWCFIFSMATLLLWFAMVGFMGDWVFSWHAKFSNITREQFNAIHYQGMMFLKLGASTLFLFPWAGIKLMQRKSGK